MPVSPSYESPPYTISPSASIPISCTVPQTPHVFEAIHATSTLSRCSFDAGFTVSFL